MFLLWFWEVWDQSALLSWCPKDPFEFYPTLSFPSVISEYSTIRTLNVAWWKGHNLAQKNKNKTKQHNKKKLNKYPSLVLTRWSLKLILLSLKWRYGTPGWLSRLSGCLRLGSWSQGPGIESRIGLLARRGACFSLCLPLPLLVFCLSDK